MTACDSLALKYCGSSETSAIGKVLSSRTECAMASTFAVRRRAGCRSVALGAAGQVEAGRPTAVFVAVRLTFSFRPSVRAKYPQFLGALPPCPVNYAAADKPLKERHLYVASKASNITELPSMRRRTDGRIQQKP
jgi:hypothetical protein